MKAVCIDQNGEKVLMAVVEDDTTQPVGAELLDLNSAVKPATSPEIRAFIDQNPHKSLNLHKVVGGDIVLRSPQELAASNYITWDWKFEEPPVEEPPIE